MDSMVDAIFAYGGLIRPTSIMDHLIDLSPVEPIYEQELTIGDEGLIREDALETWKEQDRIKIIPVKLHGYKRKYNYDSPRSGAMLSAVKTGNNKDWINGTIIVGLPRESIKSMEEMEKGYKKETLNWEEFEPYFDKDEIDFEEPQSVRVFLEADNDHFKENLEKNQTYHDRIIAGIKILAEKHGEELGREFLRDFLATTYENGRPLIEQMDEDTRLPHDIQPV